VKTSNAVKDKWNADHYAQVKVHVDPKVAAAFKAACAVNEVSMASELSKFMTEYSHCGSANVGRAPKTKDPLASRPKRRVLLTGLLRQLEQIKSGEEAYRDNIPENLQTSMRYEAAEESISGLEEAIEILAAVY
jgi:hypothetical protein